MKGIEAYLEERTEEYVKTVQKKAYNGKTLAIYGAGNIGMCLYSFLQRRSMDIKFFCVTDVNSSPGGGGLPIPLYGVDEVERAFGSEVCFLLGVNSSFQSSIIKTLETHGFHNVVKLPRFMAAVLNDRFRRPLIQVTPRTGCSINCNYCPQEIFVRKYFSQPRPSMMSLEEFKVCLDKMPQNTIIEFAGFVEPFLNPEAAEMMLYTASTGREVNLFTTLVGMTWDTWEKIKGIPFEMVVLHLPDVKGYANISITEEYLKLLQAMVNEKKPDGRPFVDRANSQSTIHPDVLKLVEGKFYIDNAPLIDRAGNLDSEGLQSGGVPHGPLFCPTAARLDHNILLPDGSLVLCCMDFGMQHVLGNLMEESYEEIMQGERLRDIKEKMQTPESGGLLCRKCVRAVQMR